MKLMPPALPQSWRSSSLEDGTIVATVPNSPLGCFTTLFTAWVVAPLCLAPFFAIHFPAWTLQWTLPFGPLGLGAMLWRRFGTQEWLFSPAGLEIRYSILGKVLRRITLAHGSLSIAGGGELSWVLRLHRGDRTRLLHHSSSLTELLAFSAFLQDVLGWSELEGSSLPPYVRIAIEQELITGGRELIRKALDETQVLHLLTQMWREGEPRVRNQILEIYAILEKENAWLSRLAEMGSPETQCCAVEILGALDDVSSLPILRRALESPLDAVRRRAVVALGQRRDLDAVPTLCHLVRSVPDLQQSGAWALGEIRDAAAIPTLADLLANTVCEKDAPVRRAAATALGRLKDAAAVPALTAALKDRTPTVRESAVEALAMLGDPAGIPSLIQAVHDHERAVATSAVTALGRIGHVSVIPELCRVLAEDGLDLRVRAAAALGTVGGVAAVEALCRALDDPDAGVRYHVVCALQRLAAPSALVPVQIRAAIPRLRALGGHLSGEATELTEAARRTLLLIEAGTGSMKQLPLPAEGTATEPAQLPLPAGPRTTEPQHGTDEPVTALAEVK